MINNIRHFILNRMTFAVSYSIYAVVSGLPTFFNLGFTSTALRYFMVLYGVIMIVYTLTNKELYEKTEFRIIAIFFAICIISVFINPNLINLTSFRRIISLGTLIIVLFTTFYGINKEEADSFLYRYCIGICAFTLIFSLVSLIFLLSRSISFTSDGRYPGIYGGVWQAGQYALTSLICTVYLYKRGFNKALCYLNLLIQIIILYLSDSRTSILCFYILIFFFAFSFKYMRKRRIICLMISVITIALMHFSGETILRSTQNYYINASNNTANDIGFNDSNRGLDFNNLLDDDQMYTKLYEGIDLFENKSELYLKINALSSNRIILWESSLNEVYKRPIVGYGYKSNNINFHIALDFENSHNLIINLLLWVGVVGVIPFCLFIVMSFKKVLKTHDDLSIKLIGIAILWIVLLKSLLEFGIISDTTITTVLFWFVLSYYIFGNIDIVN